MKKRVLAIFGLLVLVLFAGVINFAIEVFFTEPKTVNTTIIAENAVFVDFPAAFRRSWKTAIIVPPTTVDVSGNRSFLLKGKYLFFYDNKYYWVSENLIIVDFANYEDLIGLPVVDGIDFKLANGVYTPTGNTPEWIEEILNTLLADDRVLSLITYIDFEDSFLILRRGIKVKVTDWKKVVVYKELLVELEKTAADKSEYMFLSDGKMLRVR